MKTTRSRGEAAKQRRLLLQRVLSVVLAASMTLQGLTYAPVRAYAEGEDDAATVELAGGEGLAVTAEEGQAEEGQPEEGEAEEGQQPSGGQGDEQPAEPVDGQGDEQPAEPTGEEADGQGDEQPTDEQPTDEQPAEPTGEEGDEQPAEPTEPTDEPDAVTIGWSSVKADVLYDDGSVKATVEVEGDLPSDATLAVSEISAEDAAKLAGEAAEASFAYDVTIVSEGAAWHPEDGAKLTVRVTRPEGMEGLPEGLSVVHFKDVVVTKGADESFALDADALATLAARVSEADETLATETAEVTPTEDGRLQFDLTGLSPFVGATPKAGEEAEEETEKAPAVQLRASVNNGNNEGSGIVDGLGIEYSWSIKWDTPEAEGQNVSNVTYDDNTNSLEFHPSDWTTLSEAVLKVQFHVNPGEGGSGSIPAGAVKFTLPLHAFYDKDGNGTDQSTGYEVLVDHGENLFKHEIVGDQIVITNWQEITSADMSLQISYKVDPLRVSGGHPAEDNADITGDNWWENYTGYYQKTLPASFEMEVGDEKVSEDAPLNIAMKTRAKGTGAATPMPTRSNGIYLSWDDAWGEKPADADDYIYLVWCLGYGWGHRVDDKTYYGKMSTQGFKTNVSALKSDNQVTFGGKTFEGEIIGTDYHDLTGTYPSGNSLNSGTTYMSNYGLAGLYGKTAPDYQKVTTNGYNNKSLENVLTNGTQGTQDWAGTGGYAVLMRYPKEMIEAAAEELGEDKLKTEGFPVAAKFTVTETWDSGYTTERKVEATPATVVIKKASGAGEFKKHSGSIAGSYKTIPGGQTQLLNGQDVYLNRAGSQSATSHVESWGMTWNGHSFSESVEGGGNNLGQHIVITDTEDATLLISSRKAKNATTWEPEGQEELSGEAGDYSINGFWITLSEYTGSYDPDYDVWTPSSTSSKEFDKYEPVYIEARQIGGDFKPYCVVRRVGDSGKVSDYEVRQWDGTTEGAVIPRDWGEYALPEDTIQVRAVHDSTDFVHCVLGLYVAVIIHPTPDVVEIVQKHVNDDATTVIKNVASYDVTPATGKEPLVPGDDEYHKTGNNVLPNNATDVFITLNQLSSSLTLSKQAYVPPENNEDQIEANLHDKQVAYVQLQAFTQLDVPQSETVISEVEDPYKLLEGTFYELLPKGVQFDMNSVKVIYDMNFSDQNMGAANYQNVDSKSMLYYRKVVPQENITVTPVYNDATGQTLVKIEYKLEDPGLDYSSPQQNWRCRARCYFKLENSFDNIQSYGRQTLNACAYENTTPGAGHSLDTSQTLTNAALGDQAAAFEDLATNDIISRYSKETISWHSLAYTETSFAKTASAIETVGGVVVDDQFSTEQNVTINNEYKYRLLYKLVDTTQGKDIVFYDILDSGKNSEGQELESDWQGKLVGVDVSAIEGMHNYKDSTATCVPVVYYSTTASGKVSSGSTFDLTDGSWTKADEYSGDLAAVKAIAIDCSKDSKGADYVMPPGAAMMAFVTMKAPGELPSGDDPTAVNGAIVRSQTFAIGQTSGSTQTNLGYTKVKLHDVEVGITKDSDPMTGSANDPTKVKPDGNGKITYRLTVHNTSDYDSRNVTLTDVLPEGLTLDDVKVALNGTPEDEATDGTSTTGFSYEFDEASRALTFNIVRQYVSTDDVDRDTHIYINCTVDSLLSADNNGKQVMSRDYENTATLDEANEKTFGDESEPTYHRAETMLIPVEKVWENDDNLKHLRPEDVTVTLTGTTGDETIVDEQATLEDPDWADSFIDLPKWAIDDADTDYDTPTTAAEITYDLEEVAVDGYGTEVTGSAGEGYTVTNTVKSGELTVEKEIVNARFLSDYDIKFDFTVTLSDNKINGTFGGMTFTNGVATFKLSAGKSAKATGLPQGVTYTVVETPYTGFDITKEGDTGTISGTPSKAVFTNNNKLEEYEGTKVWKDEDYQGKNGYQRPESIKVKLIGEVEADGGKKTVIETPVLTVTETENWSYKWMNLPSYKDGNKITYRVVETGVPDGFKVSYKDNNVINTPLDKVDQIDPVSFNIMKTDVETGHALKGALFEVKNAAGETVMSETTGENGVVTFEFTAEGEYTLTETSPTGYSSDPGSWTIVVSKSGVDKVKYNDPNEGFWTWFYHLFFGEGTTVELDESSTLNVANTPSYTELEVQKKWDDDDDRDGLRPKSIEFQLYKKVGDAEPVAYRDPLAVSGEGDEWSGKFEKLPEYEDGLPVTYTVDEVAVPDGYEKTVSDDGLTITNTHVPELIEVPVTKTWDDGDNINEVRPESITVKLLADDAEVDSATIEADEDGNWAHTFTELLKYRDHGTEIIYTVEEEAIPGYDAAVSGSASEGYAIVNTHEVDVITVDPPVKKTVEGEYAPTDPEFTFMFTADPSASALPEGMSEMPMPAGSDGQVKTVTVTGGGEYEFGEFEIRQPGTYVYSMTEEATGDLGWTYDGSSYTVTYVVEAVDGHLAATTTIAKDGEEYSGTPEFVNTFEATMGSLTVSKAVWSDSAADKDRDFTFTVRLAAPDGTGIDGTFGGVEFAGGEAEVTLRDGESVTMEGIPAGAAYEVAEAEAEGFRCDAPANATGTIPADGAEAAVAFANVRLVDVTAAKAWDDGNDRDALRPESVTFELWASINGTDAATGRTATLTADGKWATTFEGLASYANVGGGYVPVTYSVRELDANGAAIATTGGAYDGNYSTTYSADGLTVTNRHVPTDPPTPTPPTPTRMPKTGDPADPALTRAVAMAGASLAGTGIVLAVSRYLRRREDER